MTTTTTIPCSTPALVTEAFLAAAQAVDLDAIMALTSPDVILHSPIMGGEFKLEARGEVAQAFRILLDGFDELAFTDVFTNHDTQVLAFSGRARGRRFDGMLQLRLDRDLRIDEVVFYVRPFLGLANFARVVGPSFMRPHNRLWAMIAAGYGWFVSVAIRVLVALGGPMVKASVRRLATRPTLYPKPPAKPIAIRSTGNRPA